MVARQFAKPVTPYRTLEVELEMIEPVGRLYEGRSRAHDRVGDARAVRGCGVVNLLAVTRQRLLSESSWPAADARPDRGSATRRLKDPSQMTRARWLRV